MKEVGRDTQVGVGGVGAQRLPDKGTREEKELLLNNSQDQGETLASM